MRPYYISHITVSFAKSGIEEINIIHLAVMVFIILRKSTNESANLHASTTISATQVSTSA